MVIPATLSAMIAVLGTHHGNPSYTPPSPPWPSTVTAAPSANSASKKLRDLSMDELIQRLPLAGTEWSWNAEKKEGEEEPSSAEMERRLDAGAVLTDEQWMTALLRTKAIRFRTKWPLDVPYAVSLTVPRWLGLTQIRVRADRKDWKTSEAGELMSSTSGTFPMIRARNARRGTAMGPLAPDMTELVFEIQVERGRPGLFDDESEKKKRPKPGVLWTGTIETPFRPVGSWDDAIPASAAPGLDEAVKDAIGAGVRTWGEEKTPVPFLTLDPDCSKYPMLATTALDIKAELLEGDEVIAESWLVASDADRLRRASSVRTGPVRFYGSTNLKVEREKPDPSRWKVRLTGQCTHGWMLWHATEAWKGSMTIPWAELVKQEQERVGPEGRVEMSTPSYR